MIAAYSNLLAVQYHDKPKAKATIDLMARLLLADMLLWRLRDEWLNVDKSIGPQLDQVGQWVGVDRFFKGQKFDDIKFYAYYDWNDEDQPGVLQAGLIDWNEADVWDNPILTYDWILSIKNKLVDEDFRFLIKLKIIKNNANMTCQNIDDEIFRLFNHDIYTVWGECMELTYCYPNAKNVIMKLAQAKGVLPVPTGVKLQLQEY